VRFFSEERPVGRRIDDDRLEPSAEEAPFLFCCSISIGTTSFSVVSLMAMVPERGQAPVVALPPARFTSVG
jgi:hypothetical protein